VQRRAKQPHYSLNYTALIHYKFLLTYSYDKWQHSGITPTYQAVAVFFQAKTKPISNLYFLETHT